jgi:hypothetical protein
MEHINKDIESGGGGFLSIEETVSGGLVIFQEGDFRIG